MIRQAVYYIHYFLCLYVSMQPLQMHFYLVEISNQVLRPVINTL